MVEEAFTMSLRFGDWKYIAPFSGKTPDWLKNKAVPTGLQAEPQLFNLKDDPMETHNIADQYPDNLDKLSKSLAKIINGK